MMKFFFFCWLRAFTLPCSDHTSPPAAAHLQKEPLSVLPLMSLQVPAPPLLAGQSLSPEMPLAGHILQIPDWSGVSLAEFYLLNFISTEFYQHVSCAWGAKLNATTRCGLMRAKKRRIILKISSEWILVCLSQRKVLWYAMVLAQLALFRQSMAQCSIYP